jgi:hypothetical protein
MAAQDDFGLAEMRGKRLDIIRAALVRVKIIVVGCVLDLH